jgi:hypothetical protein
MKSRLSSTIYVQQPTRVRISPGLPFHVLKNAFPLFSVLTVIGRSYSVAQEMSSRKFNFELHRYCLDGCYGEKQRRACQRLISGAREVNILREGLGDLEVQLQFPLVSSEKKWI